MLQQNGRTQPGAAVVVRLDQRSEPAPPRRRRPGRELIARVERRDQQDRFGAGLGRLVELALADHEVLGDRRQPRGARAALEQEEGALEEVGLDHHREAGRAGRSVELGLALREE